MNLHKTKHQTCTTQSLNDTNLFHFLTFDDTTIFHFLTVDGLPYAYSLIECTETTKHWTMRKVPHPLRFGSQDNTRETAKDKKKHSK